MQKKKNHNNVKSKTFALKNLSKIPTPELKHEPTPEPESELTLEPRPNLSNHLNLNLNLNYVKNV